MAFKLELPDIGEGVVEAEVQQWFVAPGDAVAEDQPLVEVMTDKATVVIPSPRRGRVTQLFWKVGDVARVHAPLLELELEQGTPSPAPKSPDRAAVARAASAAATTSPSPVGASVAAPAPGDGHAGAGRAGQKALATPAVRALARELGIDVNAVGGTGRGGRVTKEDLAAAHDRTNGHDHPARAEAPPATPVTQPVSRPAPGPASGVARPAPALAPAPSGEDERIPLRGVRKRIAENMARSKRTAAHFTFVEEADVTELVRVKDRIARAAQPDGVKVTFLPFVVKAVVAALRKHPILNASLDDERGEIVVHHRYDIGIATATEGGLTVPVVRGADRRSLLDLAREIERLAQDAKAGRARPEDMGRSTFTVTSLGALGGLFATPVLNHPEVGILGLHRIRPTPVVRDGQVVVRDVMHVSLTSDHRVVDGHVAAAFTYQVIAYLEDPNLLFMEMV